ncbi:unnamed protein product [Schistocephalus solidus]|uniref:Uncharacterized protein n=1 Tax=Schistocephalus solidus TaxID=70667 RepID=A0A183SKE5_SCHSO|nr:unnamed protein product [Schistocephalus solidus]
MQKETRMCGQTTTDEPVAPQKRNPITASEITQFLSRTVASSDATGDARDLQRRLNVDLPVMTREMAPPEGNYKLGRGTPHLDYGVPQSMLMPRISNVICRLNDGSVRDAICPESSSDLKPPPLPWRQ